MSAYHFYKVLSHLQCRQVAINLRHRTLKQAGQRRSGKKGPASSATLDRSRYQDCELECFEVNDDGKMGTNKAQVAGVAGQ